MKLSLVEHENVGTKIAPPPSSFLSIGENRRVIFASIMLLWQFFSKHGALTLIIYRSLFFTFYLMAKPILLSLNKFNTLKFMAYCNQRVASKNIKQISVNEKKIDQRTANEEIIE